MTTFDKLCAVLTIPIGAVFLIVGAVGLFTGSNAHFDLPPILGFLPFLLGWSMCVTLIRFWRRSSANINVKPETEVYSGLFAKFLLMHPEFRSADSRLQWAAFHKWVNDPQRHSDPKPG
ncbi:MAG: hypothetical protein J0M04_16655 [Verrucomicrobia bacterium]|nr:hypothetical protein [Verrucomicrobiota bacterium]